MAVAAVVLCALLAAGLTLFRSAGTAFVLVYLPALLLLPLVPPLELPGLPDAPAPAAAIYGILIGGLLGRQVPRLRFSPVDAVVGSLLVAYLISAFSTGGARSAVSMLGLIGLELVAPYFIARCTLDRPSVRAQALRVLVPIMLVITLFVLLELRLWPYTYEDIMMSLGLTGLNIRMALIRFGLFRAKGPFWHQIDLGNSAGLMLAILAVLAWRFRGHLRDRWIQMGLGASAVSSLAALSFSSLLGLGSGLLLFFGLDRIRPARRLLVPLVLVLIVAGFAVTQHLSTAPLGERPDMDADPLVQSYYIRQLIVHRSWEAATTAGPFGWGYELAEIYDLDSTDNAYLLIAMQRGWVGLGLWLALPVCLAAMASRALRGTWSRAHTRAILAGFSGVIGTMVSMFTVFLGFSYASLLMVMVALTANAVQARKPRRARARRRRIPARSQEAAAEAESLPESYGGVAGASAGQSSSISASLLSRGGGPGPSRPGRPVAPAKGPSDRRES
jgi:hypothetical protein